MILHDYWRSTAAYRVRIGLNLKRLSYAQVAHDLRRGEQRTPEYLRLSRQGLVPAIEIDEGVLTQSLAILEWLEERQPSPPLLPPDAFGRAIVRSMAALVAADIHPVNNLRILNALREVFAAKPEQIQAWMARWIGEGFGALDGLVAQYGGVFAYGDAPGLADCFIVPQVYAARRFAIDMSPYPNITRVAGKAATLASFVTAHPDRQPDADAS